MTDMTPAIARDVAGATPDAVKPPTAVEPPRPETPAKPKPAAPAMTKAFSADAAVQGAAARYEETAAQREAARKSFDEAHPAPQKPNMQPWSQKLPEHDPVRAFGSWASVFGILVGAMARAPLATSLNASASAMEAMRRGDLATYEDAKKTWKDNSEMAVKNAEWEWKAYQDAWGKFDKNWGEREADVKTVAALANNAAMLKISGAQAADSHITAGLQQTINARKIIDDESRRMDAQARGVQDYNEERAKNPTLPALAAMAPTQRGPLLQRLTAHGERLLDREEKQAVMRQSTEQQAISAYMAAHPGTSFDAARNAVAKGVTAAKDEGRAEAAQAAMSPEEYSAMATRELYTGQRTYGLPKDQRTLVEKYKTKIQEDSGIPIAAWASIPGQKKQEAADYGKLLAYSDAVDRSVQVVEGTFDRAIALKDELISLVGDTQATKISSMIMNGAASFPGLSGRAGEVAVAYQNQMNTLAVDYARLVNGPLSNAMLREGARDNAIARFNANFSKGQLEEERKQVRSEATLSKEVNEKKAEQALARLRQPISASPAATVVQPVPGATPPPAASASIASLPESARAALKEGSLTKFGNGQTWTLKNGQPMQVR